MFYQIFIFHVYWSQHTVYWQSEKNMASGQVPNDAAAHPQFFGGINFLICLSEDVISKLQQHLTNEVGQGSNLGNFILEICI